MNNLTDSRLGFDVDLESDVGSYGTWAFKDFAHAVKFFRRAIRIGYWGRLTAW
jgi:hypothetical protein